jgi:hypothetical protein
MFSFIKYILWFLVLIITFLIIYFFIGFSSADKEVKWGINFSKKQAQFLEIDSKEAYLALIEDIGFKDVKISVHWDLIEKEKEVYDFEELDWQIKIAEENNVNIILAIGMKTPRWPECHLPFWIRNMEKVEQQKEILKMLKTFVERYKDSPSVVAWQVENEAFLDFGACPWQDEKFLKKEISFVRSIDNSRPIITTDSGELSLWVKSSQAGADIIGVTTYRKVWQNYFKSYVSYPLPPIFYERRMKLVNKFFDKEVIGTELQAEPWCANSMMDSSLKEMKETMSLEQFKKNVEFAKKTGIKTFYFWGGEWWYQMKTVHGDSQIWDEVKKIIN